MLFNLPWMVECWLTEMTTGEKRRWSGCCLEKSSREVVTSEMSSFCWLCWGTGDCHQTKILSVFWNKTVLELEDLLFKWTESSFFTFEWLGWKSCFLKQMSPAWTVTSSWTARTASRRRRRGAGPGSRGRGTAASAPWSWAALSPSWCHSCRTGPAPLHCHTRISGGWRTCASGDCVSSTVPAVVLLILQTANWQLLQLTSNMNLLRTKLVYYSMNNLVFSTKQSIVS